MTDRSHAAIIELHTSTAQEGANIMMTNNEMRETIRQMLADWNSMTDQQRTAILAANFDAPAPDTTYNGYTNRETWAVALHVNNDQGWQESVHEAIREVDSADRAFGYRAYVAGQAVREQVEQVVTVDGYMDVTGFDCLPPELSRIAEDIGSLYRVDWDSLGRIFLSDLEELDASS